MTQLRRFFFLRVFMLILERDKVPIWVKTPKQELEIENTCENT